MNPLSQSVLVIEGCDYVCFPPGGSLSFARQLAGALGSNVALVGLSTEGCVTGRWTERCIGGQVYPFLPIGVRRPRAERPLVPARLRILSEVLRHREVIMSAGVRNVFIQAPECLIAAHDWGWDSLCYMFHGLGNSVAISRYPWARRLSKVYEAMLYRALRSADVILAAAGQKEVAEFRENAIRRGVRGNIASFPTRVDTAIFRPVPASYARRTLGFSAGGPVIAVSGRLSRFKGWELMLDAFVVLRRRFPEARLVFIGDGEQREQLLKRTSDLGLESSVSITGFQAPQEVAAWLNAADLVAVASFVEGWSVAMLEALSCGKPIVTTDVSGAAEMIVPGKNGLIVYDRSPDAFGEAMELALTFPNVDVISTSIARRFAVETLRSDLGEIWPSARQSAFT